MSFEELIAAALEPVIRRVVSEELKKERIAASAPSRPLSASAAAKRAKVRIATLLAALESKELAADFDPKPHGGRGAWSVDIAELDQWAKARRIPVAKSA